MNTLTIAGLGCTAAALRLLRDLVEKGMDGHRFWMVLPGWSAERWLLMHGSTLVGYDGLVQAADALTAPRRQPQLSIGLAAHLYRRGLPYPLAVETELTVNLGKVVFALQTPSGRLGHRDLCQILHEHEAHIHIEMVVPSAVSGWETMA